MQEMKTNAIEKKALYNIGTPVRHKKFGFRGVIFDIDPVFSNTEEWYQSIPEEMRPRKDQPFYHLFAENQTDHSPYLAYVSEQNLVPENSEDEINHPAIDRYFEGRRNGVYKHRLSLH